MKLFLLFFVFRNIVVLGFSNLIASNIKSGIDIFGITGNFSGWVDDNLWVWADSTYTNGGMIMFSMGVIM